jgi:hypothetical protein
VSAQASGCDQHGAGRVRHEHITSLGSVPREPSIHDRFAFWTALRPRLDRLANRVGEEGEAAIIAALTARIPAPTKEEARMAGRAVAPRRAVQAANCCQSLGVGHPRRGRLLRRRKAHRGGRHMTWFLTSRGQVRCPALPDA